MATNLDYNINVNTTQGVQALNNLQNKIGGLNNAFSGLKSAIAGIAVGAFIADAFKSANALTDMAKAANVSTQALLGFRDAVTANGGEAQAAVDSMGKFSQAIEGAANGSVELQDKFLQLGISLNDLRTMSEEQLLTQVIKGLADGTAGASTMATAMSFFGKSFRAVDFKGVAADINGTTAAALDAAAGYNAAGDTQQRFSNSITTLQRELLKALTPISELAAGILESSAAVSKFIQIAVQIGLVVASFTLLGKAIQAIRVGIVALVAGWEALVGFFTVASNGVSQFGLIMETVFSQGMMSGVRVIGTLLGQMGEWAMKSIPGIGALAVALGQLWGYISDGAAWLGKMTGWWGDASKVAQESADKVAAAEKAKADAAAKSAREVQDALAKQILSIRQASDEFGKANKKILDQINLDNSLIGSTKAVSDAVKAQEEIFKRAADESDKLRDAKEKLSDAEKRRGLGSEYDKQIAKIQQIAEADAARVKAATENTNRLEMLDKIRLFGIQSQIDSNKQLQQIQDDIAKMTMSEIEKKYYDIEAAAKASAKAAIEAEEARIGRPLNTAEQKAYYDTAIKGTNDLKKAQADAYSKSREFSTGWKQAFNEYIDNATNAAKAAQRIFQKATQGMEDLIVNFAKTGKFEWKNFVSMMLEELLRSQIQQVFAGMLNGMSGGMGGGGGILGALGGLFGGGGGGTPGASANNPMYVIDVSGGGGAGAAGGGIFGGMGGQGAAAGGGLFGSIGKAAGSAWEGIKGIGSSIGGLFGGGQAQDPLGDFIGKLPGMGDSGGGGGGGGILDSISGMFDGWFANGGTIGAGKFGVVGENGPELVGGPATVTPMGGGGTNVTYNINAIDTQSFKQLLASDPSFIYALSLQGGGNIPARR